LKNLSLLRHATAVKDPRFVDFDRPLDPTGELEVMRLGMALRDLDAHFDQIFCSPAVRTVRTAALLLQAMDHPTDGRVTVERAMYTSSTMVLFRMIGRIPDDHDHVLLVGHNPEFTELANRLSIDVGELDPCTYVRFEFDVDSWLSLEHATPVNVAILRPPH